uniref:Uncharacterized protein n=1 Tax=Glossina pallidipes TaxID=7398 RepID=A0A1A9Z4B0_GLOPL
MGNVNSLGSIGLEEYRLREEDPDRRISPLPFCSCRRYRNVTNMRGYLPPTEGVTGNGVPTGAQIEQKAVKKKKRFLLVIIPFAFGPLLCALHVKCLRNCSPQMQTNCLAVNSISVMNPAEKYQTHLGNILMHTVATMMSCPLPMPLPIIPSLHEFSPVHIGVKLFYSGNCVGPELNTLMTIFGILLTNS